MAQAQTARKVSNSRQQPEMMQETDPMEIGRDLVEHAREYIRENPESAALWALGIGFVLGWKLKIW
jgi:ElaB/YqjD/DUF883 family membrane-anchored ribosome-binding protein